MSCGWGSEVRSRVLRNHVRCCHRPSMLFCLHFCTCIEVTEIPSSFLQQVHRVLWMGRVKELQDINFPLKLLTPTIPSLPQWIWSCPFLIPFPVSIHLNSGNHHGPAWPAAWPSPTFSWKAPSRFFVSPEDVSSCCRFSLCWAHGRASAPVQLFLQSFSEIYYLSELLPVKTH